MLGAHKAIYTYFNVFMMLCMHNYNLKLLGTVSMAYGAFDTPMHAQHHKNIKICIYIHIFMGT